MEELLGKTIKKVTAFQNLQAIPVITPPTHPEDINYIVNYRNEN